MTAVLKHELTMYYHSMKAYIFGAFLLLITGFGSLIYNINSSLSNFEYVLSFIAIALIVLVPILTMRSMAEEKKQKTDQLLFALPITSVDIIVGKFLAMAVVFAIPMIVICIYPVIFAQYGDVYLPTSYGSIFAFYLMGLALLSEGLFISCLTESQSVSAGVCIAVMMLNYFLTTITSYASNILDGIIPKIAEKISLFSRFGTFVNGVFDISTVVYFLSVTVLFIFLSVQAVEQRRYNG